MAPKPAAFFLAQQIQCSLANPRHADVLIARDFLALPARFSQYGENPQPSGALLLANVGIPPANAANGASTCAFVAVLWGAMASPHGNRNGYIAGCRCDRCKASQRVHQQEYRGRVADGTVRPRAPSSAAMFGPLPPSGPGRVEAAVGQEIEGLPLAAARPALVKTAVSLAKILDNPRAVSQQPAAAGKLVDILDRLHKGSVARRGGLRAVKAMTTPDRGA